MVRGPLARIYIYASSSDLVSIYMYIIFFLLYVILSLTLLHGKGYTTFPARRRRGEPVALDEVVETKWGNRMRNSLECDVSNSAQRRSAYMYTVRHIYLFINVCVCMIPWRSL